MTVPFRTAVFAMGVVLSTVLPATAAATAQGSGGGAAADVVAEVNRRRAEAGCGPLRLRADLTRAAQAHSADMARHGRLDHIGSDGSRPHERMRAAGYRARHSGEAIASASGDAGTVTELWMESPGHRDLILTCRYRDAGVGRADRADGPWWTLDLATGP
ncbi:CAP domain-containing protein [Streptomyces cavernicola]|uniref:CAP domain-containing protein n=1 Tax=Streptomyces cavernicola TaxID=3043613 RepID=A0ABT6SC85_9ACTN|nr:CAP domain-containing protein [Streptomyces sp. B-S-A6]MDI3405570.1 CAP domain-containing protein [Streptomyces sp. B-S-A6]